jgi:predicted esterase
VPARVSKLEQEDPVEVHAVSGKHLHRYLSEFEFRYNTRWFEDGHRTALAIQAADGRRLTYREQVAS